MKKIHSMHLLDRSDSGMEAWDLIFVAEYWTLLSLLYSHGRITKHRASVIIPYMETGRASSAPSPADSWKETSLSNSWTLSVSTHPC